MDVGKIIAENIQKICSERNFSLRQLAKLSGVNTTTLAQIAKGDGNPTINVLLKITKALKVPYTKLLEEQKKRATVVRKHECVSLVGENPAYQIFNYFKYSSQRNIELFYVTLDAKSKNESSGHILHAQEYIFVISGSLTMYVDKNIFTLEEQDALVFESSSVHVYENKTENPVNFISINCYP